MTTPTERSVYCRRLGMEDPKLMSVVVSECSEYDDKRVPSLWEMKKIAWTLVVDKSGRRIGFTPPKKEDNGD